METGAERGGLSSGVPRVTNVWPPAPPTVGGARLPSEDAQSALCGPVALCSRRPRDPLTACVPPPAVTWLASNTKRALGRNHITSTHAMGPHDALTVECPWSPPVLSQGPQACLYLEHMEFSLCTAQHSSDYLGLGARASQYEAICTRR
ncbi:uncharacterized protein [Oryctolagus cuniculus]|uniref:uncharacterized protein isoform X2 n=1 Tax=Oryctolagus cuniculus TaxID=9986 RepID=UPI00387A550E